VQFVPCGRSFVLARNHAIFRVSPDQGGLLGGTAPDYHPVSGPQWKGGGVIGTDAFVTKLDALGRTLLYSSFLGGSNYD
jgi:hypothetical protein